MTSLHRPLVALALLLPMLAGCGSADGRGGLLYGDQGELGALHSNAQVGRPMAEAVQQAGQPPSEHRVEPDGTEIAIWTRADVDLTEARTLACQEVLTARNGIVTSYQRSGNRC